MLYKLYVIWVLVEKYETAILLQNDFPNEGNSIVQACNAPSACIPEKLPADKLSVHFSDSEESSLKRPAQEQ